MSYSTTDLSAAAYLLSQGCRLVRVVPGSWSTFVFEDDGTATRLIEQWNLGDPVGSLKAYAVAQQEVRRAMRRAA